MLPLAVELLRLPEESCATIHLERMGQNLCLIRIGRAEFVGEFRLSVKRLCFCLVIYNECAYIRLISI